MTFNTFTDLKGYQKFAVSLTSALVVAVSIYIVLFNLISFDGAFNAQAAINLYQKGTLALDYRPNNTLQTLLPFQVVNGFFLTIFGNTFLAANLANIFFYFLLFGLFVSLATLCRSILPLLAFSAISLTPAFIFQYGFGGFGEVPALTFGLIGVSCLVFKKDSYIANILAGILIACALTTKWILFLILPSVLLTLVLLKLEPKKLLLFLAAAIFTFSIVSFLQFSHFKPDEIEKLLQSLVMQNTPHYGGEYLSQKVHHIKTYGLRLNKIWKAYSSFSFGIFGPFKIGLSVVIFFVAIHVLIDPRERLKRINIFFIFLASFLFVYLFWAFALNSRWPVRRMLNTDVLLYLGISLLPCIARFGKTGRFAIFGFFSIFISICILFLFSYTKEKGLISVIDYESQMKKGLQLLPEDYNAYGQGHLEAPHWSFLAGKEFKDLLRDSVFYDCIENECNSYLFLQPSNPLNKPQLDFVHEIFQLNNIYEFRGFQISRIKGFNNREKKYVEEVDFTEERATNSIAHIHERTRDEMYSPPNFEFNEMAVFLDNKRGLPLIEVVFTAHVCHDGKNLRIALVNNKRKYVKNFPVTQGENRIEISLPKEFRGSNIDLYLLLEKEPRSRDPHCLAQNINRIPLEYKIIQLVSKTIDFKEGVSTINKNSITKRKKSKSFSEKSNIFALSLYFLNVS